MRPTFAYADILPEPAPIVQQYCSCVSGVRVYIPDFPHVDAVYFATMPHNTPAAGRVAVFDYSGTFHVAYILSIEEKGFWIYEWNFKKCQKDTRFIDWNDPHIESFFAPAVPDVTH